MTGQLTTQPLIQMLGPARLATYVSAAGGDLERATELYMWVTEVAGALHSQLSFVELAVRNAMDPQLSAWNATYGSSADWTAENLAAQPLYQIVRKPLDDARFWAEKESGTRPPYHPRHGAAVTHDDIIAQLMFGTWVKIVQPASGSPWRQMTLWSQGINQAFPLADQTEIGRQRVGHQLTVLRKLRNRVAHHDNLLQVQLTHRQNTILSVLGQINPELATLASSRTALRRLAKQDPRLTW